MANELAIHLTTGLTLYAQRLNSANLVWDGSAYVTPVDANWADYAVTMTESENTGWYYGTDPDPGTLGGYEVFRQAGGSPAITDIPVGGGALGTQPANVTQITAAAANKIADHGRRRTQANVEASSDGDALSLGSLYGFIQQAQESSVSSTTLTIYKTDGSTSLGTKTLTVSAGADPVTGIA